MSGGRQALIDLALLALMLAAALCLTHVYVSYERFFYFWDHAVYHEIAQRTALAFRESLPAGWHALRQSYRDDYNALFALPLVPWLLAFGSSRLSYELALATVYLVPLPLSWGAVAAQLVPSRAWLAFWATAWLALLVPMTWVPVLRGYPDAGAATLLALALCLYLRDIELADRMTCLALGALLGLAVVFRRHFAYAVVAFLAAAVLRALAASAWASGPASLRLRCVASLGLRLGLVVLAGSGVALLVAADFVERMTAFDFGALYRSYEHAPAAVASWYFAPYGWSTWMLAGAGLLAGLASRRVLRARLLTVLLFGVLSALQWCWRVRQVGEHYTLHVTPFVVLGLLLLCIVIWDRLAPRVAWPLTGLVLVVGAVNLFLGLTYADRDFRARPLFAARWPPLVRFDYDEMLQLARVLRARALPEEGVYVASSSGCLNPDILRVADRVAAGNSPKQFDVASAPLVDSDGYYPMGQLLNARFVVLARPFQHHLPATEQDLVRTVYEMFDEQGELAQDFVPSPRPFALMGCSATVFERQRPTSLKAALATLARFERTLAVRPGMQPDWTVVASSHEQWLTRDPDGSTRFVAHAAPRSAVPATTAMALVPLADAMQFQGALEFSDARCLGVTLALALLQPGGAVEPLAELRRRPGEERRFDLRLTTRPDSRLLLSVLDYEPGAVTDYCLVTVHGVTLRPAAS